MRYDGDDPYLVVAADKGTATFCVAALGMLIAYGMLGRNLGVLTAFGTVFMYIVLTQAWNILGGYGGYLNFGMVTYFGVGAYTAAMLFHFHQLSPLLTAPLGGLRRTSRAPDRHSDPAATRRLLRDRHHDHYVRDAILVLDVPITQGALGIYLAPLPLTPLGVERLFYFIFLAFALLTTILIFAIEHSNFGWALVAIREDEDAAEIVGVRTTEVKWVANALAAAIAGIAGGLYAQRIMYLKPLERRSTSLNVVLMAVIGGAGTWQGPLIGAPLVLLVADALRVTVTSEVNRVIFSLIVILIALYVPGGVMSVIGRLRRRFARESK